MQDTGHTWEKLRRLKNRQFKLRVQSLINLGSGAAYSIDSTALNLLHQNLKKEFADQLIPQDKQLFRPHITIQNKVTPQAAKSLISTLSNGFTPFECTATGVTVWTYLGGPWEHRANFLFANS